MKTKYQLGAFIVVILALFIFAFLFNEDDSKAALKMYQQEGYIQLDNDSEVFLRNLLSKYSTSIFGSQNIYINNPLAEGDINVFTPCIDPHNRFGHQLYNASYHPKLDAFFIDCWLVKHSSETPNGHSTRFLEFLILHEFGHKKLHKKLGTLFDRPIEYNHPPPTQEQYNIELEADSFALKHLLQHKDSSNETFEFLLNLGEVSITSIPEKSDLTLLQMSRTHPNFIVRLESFYRAIIEENVFPQSDETHWKRIADSYLSWINLSDHFELISVDFPYGYMPENSCILDAGVVVTTFPQSTFLIDRPDINFQSETSFIKPTRLIDYSEEEHIIDCVFDNNTLVKNKNLYFLSDLNGNHIDRLESIPRTKEAFHTDGKFYYSISWDSDNHSFGFSKINLSTDTIEESKDVHLEYLKLENIVETDEEFGSTIWHWSADNPGGPYLKHIDIHQHALFLVVHENNSTKIIKYDFNNGSIINLEHRGLGTTFKLSSGDMLLVIPDKNANSLDIFLYNHKLQERYRGVTNFDFSNNNQHEIGNIQAVLVDEKNLAVSIPGFGSYIIDTEEKVHIFKDEWNTNLNFLSKIEMTNDYLAIGFPYSRTILIAKRKNH